MAEVEARTKIRAKYLRAIENEDWGLLPGPVYIRSFLRTYGDYLGLDSRMLVEEFKRRYEEPAEHELHPIAPSRPVRREREPQRGPRRSLSFPPWLAVVAVLAAVVIVLFIVGSLSSTKHNNPQPTSARAGAHQHKHHRASTHPTTTPAPPKPMKVTLQLVPTAPVYVCLENGARKTVIPGVTYDVGQTIPTEKAVEFFLTLGNANVQMTINGKPATVPSSTTAIGLRIVPQGAFPLAPGREPTCT